MESLPSPPPPPPPHQKKKKKRRKKKEEENNNNVGHLTSFGESRHGARIKVITHINVLRTDRVGLLLWKSLSYLIKKKLNIFRNGRLKKPHWEFKTNKNKNKSIIRYEFRNCGCDMKSGFSGKFQKVDRPV